MMLLDSFLLINSLAIGLLLQFLTGSDARCPFRSLLQFIPFTELMDPSAARIRKGGYQC